MPLESGFGPALRRRLDDLDLTKIYLPLIVVLCGAFAWRPLRSVDDFWAHAAIGRWIVTHLQAPRETLFIWSAAPVPWIAHSWLTQAVFYGFMAAGGPRYGPYLVLAFTAAAIATSFVLLWRLWISRAGASVLMPVIFSLAIYCSWPRFHPRPELFTGVFLAILLVFLVHWPERGRGGVTIPPQRELAIVIGIVAMFTVWANFHGAVAVGLAIFAIAAGCELVETGFSRRSRLLAVVCLLCFAAVFINPYGWHYLQALAPVRGAMFSKIDEWKPVWFDTPLSAELVVGEAGLFLIALFAWARNDGSRWSQLLWLVFMAVSFAWQRRHLWLLALVCLAVMAANAPALDAGRLWQVWAPRRWHRLWGEHGTSPVTLRTLARILAICTLVVWLAWAVPPDLLRAGAVSATVPDKAVAFIERHKLRGRVFNDYENSSYLQWKFAGRRQLFIDLLNAYPEYLMPQYLDMAKANPQGRQLLEKYNIGLIILRPFTDKEGLATLAAYLDGNPKWKRVYKAKDGTIWLRRTLLPKSLMAPPKPKVGKTRRPAPGKSKR